ncbi:hypothetical protein ATCC90586_011506 [Pythium insidiosum]|nr:hypothetical protein ATCC90586_011506 [Pythium insidiosum]
MQQGPSWPTLVTSTDEARDFMPVYEYVRAPRLTSWNQPALVQYVRDRRQYEEKIRERCAMTGEKDVFDVTDEDLRWHIACKVGTVLNDHVPDFEQLFASSLRMDMKEQDIDARIAKYYIDFDRIMEENGLAAMVGAAAVLDEQGRQRMKLRCRLLTKHLLPEMLKTDIERLASLTHPNVKRDDVALYELVVERATRQHHFHLMQLEAKSGGSKTKKLQKFLCAVNWLRDSMVDYARTVGPLQAKLEAVMKTRGRKKTQLTGVDLVWTKEDEKAFQVVLKLLQTSTKQYFVEPTATLVPADSPTSTVAAEAILDWFKRFGLPETWVSDCGSHFKPMVMETLAERLQAVHRFTPVYSPWINGTVERVNRDILQVFRVMLMELQLDTRNWVHLLPVVQANFNHSPVESLGLHAPIELFTGLPAPSLLDTVVIPTDRAPRVLSIDLANVSASLDQLRSHLRELHAPVVDKKERKRLYEIARHKGTVCNFEPGDYVLWSRVDERLRDGKLLVRWVGPFRVGQALSHSYIITHLITGDEYEVHGSRLKVYHNTDLTVTAELHQHVANQGLVLGVRAIVGHRMNRASGLWELNVAWRGLEDCENSWEPASSIAHDVPALVRAYIDETDAAELAAAVSF